MKTCEVCGIDFNVADGHACLAAHIRAGIERGLEGARKIGVQCSNPDQITLEGPGGEQQIITLKPAVPRRVMAIATNKDALLALLLLNQDAAGKDRFRMNIVDSTKLPKDIAIEEVAFDYVRDLFLIVVASESFELVQPDAQIPVIELPMEAWDVARILPNEHIIDLNCQTAVGKEWFGLACKALEKLQVQEYAREDLKHDFGPRMELDWNHPDHATEMREQTDLLKQIRDIDAECRDQNKKVYEQYSTEPSIHTQTIDLLTQIRTLLISAAPEDRNAGWCRQGSVRKQRSQP